MWIYFWYALIAVLFEIPIFCWVLNGARKRKVLFIFLVFFLSQFSIIWVLLRYERLQYTCSDALLVTYRSTCDACVETLRVHFFLYCFNCDVISRSLSRSPVGCMIHLIQQKRQFGLMLISGFVEKAQARSSFFKIFMSYFW